MELTFFESKISTNLILNDRDSRRMDRVISDISQNTGMEKQEVLDFLVYGAEKELQQLQVSYDWETFRRLIQSKLKK
ncbi:MAG: hypothetical protein KBF93_09535 [Leptospiraceae bacterium]|nr:hypothetical protein [Leptospiraceae bacterium]